MSDKAIAYLRVSSDRQDEHSFDTQFRNITQYLEVKKWSLRNERLNGVEIELDTRVTCKLEKEGGGVFQADGCFAEKGSAYDIIHDRAQFNKMIKYVKKHKIRHLIFYKADRFSRNDMDWGNTKTQLLNAGLTDIYIHILVEKLAFNPFTKHDFEQKDKLTDLLKKAERESYEKSIYASEGVKTKFAKGQLFYNPGYGFKTYTIRRGNVKTNQVDSIKEELDDVRIMFKEFAKGDYSLSQFVERLKELGIRNRRTDKPFTRQTLYKNLTKKIYIGLITLGKKSKPATQFKSQIPKADWDKAQSILHNRDFQSNTRGKIKSYKSPLTKLGRCHYCGCQIVTDSAKKGAYVYLRCSNGKMFTDADYYKKKFGQKYCPQPYNSEQKVMEAIDEQVSKLFLDESIMVWLEAELKQIKSKDVNIKEKRIKALHADKDSLKRRLKKIYDAWETERYTDEEFDVRKAKHEGRIKEIDAELVQLSQNEDNIEEQIDLILELMETMQNQWVTLYFAKKASILGILAKEIVFGKDGKNKPLIIWELPWNAFYDLDSSSNMQGWHARRDEKRTAVRRKPYTPIPCQESTLAKPKADCLGRL